MYLSLLEVAESFGVSERAVEQWIREDDFPGIRERGRWVFDRALVIAWGAGRGVATRSGFLSLKRHGTDDTVRIETLLRRGGVHRGVAPDDVRGVLEEIVLAMPGVTAVVAPLLRARVRSRTGIAWAPVGLGLALPHVRHGAALGPESGTVAVLHLTDRLPDADSAPDPVPVTRLWFFLAPTPRTHLDILARLSRGLHEGPLHDVAFGAATDAELFAAVARMDHEEDTRRSREP